MNNWCIMEWWLLMLLWSVMFDPHDRFCHVTLACHDVAWDVSPVVLGEDVQWRAVIATPRARDLHIYGGRPVQLALPAVVPRLHMSQRVFRWSGLPGGVWHRSLHQQSLFRDSQSVCEESAAEAREHNKHRERLRGAAHDISSMKSKISRECSVSFCTAQQSEGLTHMCVCWCCSWTRFRRVMMTSGLEIELGGMTRKYVMY